MPVGRSVRGWPFGNPPNVAFRANKSSTQWPVEGWWPPLGSRGMGQLRDYSGYGSHGTIAGSITPTLLPSLGRVLDYAGNDATTYIEVQNTATRLNIAGPMTLSAWCVLDAQQTNDAMLISKRNCYGFGIPNIAGVHQFHWFVWGNDYYYGFDFNTNQLYYVAVTFDGTNYHMYVDGREVDSGASNPPPSDNTFNVMLGNLEGFADRYWNGKIGDARVHNRGLSAGEILQEYNDPWELYAPEAPMFWSVPVPTGDLAVTPTVASAITATINPTVILGSATYVPVIADAIASVSAPDVELGSLVVTPGIADAIADVIDPGVIIGGMTITPVVADAIVDVVVPDVILGSMTTTPVFASAIADTVDPDVELSSLIITPVVADAIADVVDPTASQDSLSLTPGVADAIADTVNPMVELGAMTITPVFASSIVDVVDPDVIGGDTSVTPVFAGAIVSTVAPTVLFGSVAVTPVFASAIARTINPTVIGGIGLGLESKLDISIGTIL